MFLNVPFYMSYDPSGIVEGIHFTHPDGTIVAANTQMDPLHDDVGTVDPYHKEDGGNGDPGFKYPDFSDIADLGHGCTVDGVPVMCTFAWDYKNSGGLGNAMAGTLHGMFALGSAGKATSPFSSSLGATPLLGRVCGAVSASFSDEFGSSGNATWSPCHTEIVGFTTDNYMSSGLRSLQPQDPNELKLSRAFGDASSALAAHQKRFRSCLEFFTQGRSIEEVSKIFQNFKKTATIEASSANPIAGTTNSGTGMDARVTLYAPFFADDGETEAGMLAGYKFEPVRGRYEELFTSLTPRQYRALTILHEFAHALGLIPSDKASKDQSQANNDKIYEKCGAILDKLPEY